jgi:hypothetical protein
VLALVLLPPFRSLACAGDDDKPEADAADAGATDTAAEVAEVEVGGTNNAAGKSSDDSPVPSKCDRSARRKARRNECSEKSRAWNCSISVPSTLEPTCTDKER